jgi:hypothetical protein
MSTDAQNPRYSYLTFNRIINGTGSFELDIAGSTIYRLDSNTSTVDIKLNNSGNSNIPLISKRRIDVGSNGFTKIIVTHTGIAAPETLTLLIGDSESSNTDLGVEISDYSSTVTGTVTIGGTVDVDIVGQTGQDPLHNDIVQIGGSTANATSMGNYFDINNPDNTAVTGWSYLNTGSVTILSATADTYITSCHVACFGLTSVDNTIFLTHYNAAAAIVNVLLVYTFNQALTANTNPDGTFGLSQQFPIPYKLTSGEFIRIVGGADTWSSGSIQAVTA